MLENTANNGEKKLFGKNRKCLAPTRAHIRSLDRWIAGSLGFTVIIPENQHSGRFYLQSVSLFTPRKNRGWFIHNHQYI